MPERRTGAFFCIDKAIEIKKDPADPRISTRFGKMDGAPSGARTLGTLIKSQVACKQAHQ